MKKIHFDSGIKEYSLNGQGILRFNPGDPNLYARFFEALDKIQALTEEMTTQAEKNDGELSGRDTVMLMQQTDRKVKEILSWTFGGNNDFDKILGGMNLMAVADNGRQIITNLLEALQPVLAEGAKQCSDQQVQIAMKNAEDRRKNQ